MPGELRAPLVTLDPLAEGDASIRVPLVTVDPLSGGDPNLLASFVCVDPLAEGSPNLRGSLLVVEPLAEGYRNLRCALLIIETLHPIPPEGTVSTELFPGSMGSPISLPGLSFSIHKRPTFSTLVRKAQSGVSVRNAQMQYPIWEFELSYEFLRDKAAIGLDEYRTLCGFFLSRQGGFDTFLLKDPDDYSVSNGWIGDSDGVTTQFSFKRTMGAFSEKVGQVDGGQPIVVYHAPVNEAHTIPNIPGPYTITINHPQNPSAVITEDQGVKFTIGGTALVKVGGAPAAGQYSVNLVTGVYTFNSADFNKGVLISYRYVVLAANYTVTLPNLVVFSSAPTAGRISADFQFFFNCRFQEDVADFQKFADRFWDLQQIVLETVPQ